MFHSPLQLIRAAVRSLAMLAAFALHAIPVSAQANYPQKPIQLVVGAAPGGVYDLTARDVANAMQKHLGQPVVVVNKPGANLLLATEFVKNANPDGYTLLMAATVWANVPVLYRKAPYKLEDFTPVGIMLEDYAGFIVDPKAGSNLSGWVANAKANPGAYNLATLGPGSTARLLAERFAKGAGFRFTEVPYQGSVPSLVALQSGQVQGYFGDLASSIPLHQAGRVKILAVTRPERSSALKDVPTFAEEGHADMTLRFWYGILAPAATPAPIVQKVNAALNLALADPELKRKLERNGGTVQARSPSEFQSLIKRDADMWRSIIEPLNIKLD